MLLTTRREAKRENQPRNQLHKCSYAYVFYYPLTSKTFAVLVSRSSYLALDRSGANALTALRLETSQEF